MRMNVVESLAQYGPLGILLGVSLLALRSLHAENKTERTALLAELAAERAARIQDSKDGTQLLLTVQKELLAAVDKLTDLYTMVQDERREEKRRAP
jgi:hypothetical protein